jgi:hypothetical protein
LPKFHLKIKNNIKKSAMITDRTAVAVLASIFCNPILPNIETNAAETADKIANTNQDMTQPSSHY